MPELPEVETIVRDMNDEIAGARIEDVILKTRSVWRGKIPSGKSLAGVAILRFQRLGKHILVHLSNDHALVIHLKMTGRLTVHKSNYPPSRHTHLVLKLGAQELHYNDIRRFGFIDYLRTSEITKAEYLARLGQDALMITTDEFIPLIKSRNRSIKATLLDQTIIAGLGNIYTDEALFHAGISPSRKASNISKTRLAVLDKNIKTVLKEAINARGSSVSNYVDASGRQGAYQIRHKVYGRAVEPCRDCGTKIKRMIIAGRSSHYCPRCQR